MIIRELHPDDRSPLEQILKEAGVFSRAEVGVALELIDLVLNQPEQKDYIIYTGLDRDVVIGYYCVGPTPMTEGTFDLYWIAVKTEAHNQGYGKILISHAEGLIKLKGGRLIIAETSSRPDYENTRKFYLKTHYKEVARIKDYYKIGDDLVVYGKYVSQSGAQI